MTSDMLIGICETTLRSILNFSAPMLIAALAVGILISIFQATTQIQEQTLSFVPKIIATFVAVIIFSQWIGPEIQDFAKTIIVKYIAGINWSGH
jgi:flagellar biosynthetic protein FliQ